MSYSYNSMCLVQRYTDTKVYHWAGSRETISNEGGFWQITRSSCGRVAHENSYASPTYWIPTRYVDGNLVLCKLCAKIGPWPDAGADEQEKPPEGVG